MSVRDLMVSIAFDADISKLSDLNDEVDNIAGDLAGVGDVGERSLEGIQESADDTTSNLSNVGSAGSEAVDEVGESAREAEEDVGGLGRESDNVFKNFSKYWKEITAVTATAGAGLEAFARKQGDTNVTLEQASISTGVASDELRDLAVSLSDSTTSAESNIDAMSELNRHGVDSKEQFEDLIPVLNDFNDATGQDMNDSVGSVNRILGAFGGSIEDAGEHTDQLTRMITETDISMGSLERNLARVPDELQALEFGLDDAAAGVAIFEDRGYQGKEAIREFRRAVGESEGNMDEFLQVIGLTNEEWQEYQKAAEPAEDLTRDLADVANDASTPMEKMSQSIENMMVEFGGFADLAGLIAPFLIALGPLVGFFGKLVPLVSKVGGLLTTLANPIGLVVAGIALVATGFILAYNKVEWFREGVNEVWEWLKEATAIVFDFILEKVTIVWDFIVEMTMMFWISMMELWNEHGEFIIELAMSIWDRITEAISFAMSLIQEVISIAWTVISGVIEVAWGLIQSIVETGINVVMGLIDATMSLIQGDWEDAWDSIMGIAEDIWSGIEDFFSNVDLVEIGKGIIQGLIDGISSMAEKVWEKIKEIGDGIKDKFSWVLEIFSPSRAFERFGIDTFAGYNQGAEEESKESMRVIGDAGGGILDSFDASPTRRAPVRSSSGSNNYSFNITVNGGGDAKTTAREIERVIKGFMQKEQAREV